MIAGDAKTRSFALKQMKKSQIVETRQQQHIMSGWTSMLMIMLIMMIMLMPIAGDHVSHVNDDIAVDDDMSLSTMIM